MTTGMRVRPGAVSNAESSYLLTPSQSELLLMSSPPSLSAFLREKQKEQEKKRKWNPCTLPPKKQRHSKGESKGDDRHTKKGEDLMVRTFLKV
jgi:hypothetical protein